MINNIAAASLAAQIGSLTVFSNLQEPGSVVMATSMVQHDVLEPYDKQLENFGTVPSNRNGKYGIMRFKNRVVRHMRPALSDEVKDSIAATQDGVLSDLQEIGYPDALSAANMANDAHRAGVIDFKAASILAEFALSCSTREEYQRVAGIHHMFTVKHDSKLLMQIASAALAATLLSLSIYYLTH